MRSVVSLDGIVTDPREARVSVYDRGLLFGLAVFEVMRTYGGVLFAPRAHLARLRRSAAKARIELPWSEGDLLDDLVAALDVAKAGGADGEAYVRLTVTAGDGLGLASPSRSGPRRIVLVEPLGPPPPLERAALDVLLTRLPRDADATSGREGAGTAKVTGYLATHLALAEARDAGAGDVLFVDGEGEEATLREGGTSNVFVVPSPGEGSSARRELVTPALESGVLPGITRAVLLEVARDAGLEPVERAVTVGELLAAEEAFLCSTVREIAPLRGVVFRPGVRRPIGDPTRGRADAWPIAADLLARLRAASPDRG